MPIITALTPHGRRDGRYEVAVDGVIVATVAVESVARLELKPGRELDEPALARLLEEGAVVAAVDRGLDLLAFRDRSAAELRRRLVRKGIEAGHAAGRRGPAAARRGSWTTLVTRGRSPSPRR